MPVVPKSSIDKVTFYEAHTTPWSTNATAIGTTTTAVTDLTTKTTAARAAYNAQQAAMNVAKAATQTFNDAVNAMATAGAAIINQVRAKAQMTGDSVYALAQIPAPATPSPVGAPGTPTNFKVALVGDGSLKLTWKCANPAGSSGTMYQVYRRTGATGEFAYLGGTGTKMFPDSTIPAGTSQVTYLIQAVRSTAVGAPAQYNVNFGTSGGAPVVEATNAEAVPPRLAA